MNTGLSLFTGGGLCDIGLRGIVDFIGGVEYDPSIAAHAALALGHEVTCASVCDVNYTKWLGVDYLHMSPPCTNASVANANAGETDNDKALSNACCRAIRTLRPRFVTMENVAGYAAFTAFQDILECLASEGYVVHWRVYDAADFGVPQHRKRIMLRARRDGRPLPEVLPTHGSPKDVEASRVQGKLFEEPLLPWVGWYQAIADLLPSCPDTALAPWQVKRLTAQYGEDWLNNLLIRYAVQGSEVGVPPTSPSPSLTADGCTKSRAILVGAQGYKGEVQNTAGDEPAPTPNTTSGAGAYRAILVEGQSKGKRPPSLTEPGKDSPAQAGTGGGNVNRAILPDTHRVVALTPRCLSRFQSVPDDYPLPEKKSLATKIIGNGVPSQMARAIFGPMLGGLR
jgi:DNA (cytosine-5)-methyltransferase 1